MKKYVVELPPQERSQLTDIVNTNRMAAHKHGSWLNIAEIELSALSRHCFDDYFETREELDQAITAWEHPRNESKVGIDWRFTTADARIKLKHLYPTI